MHKVVNKEGIEVLKRERALVGVFLDHKYNPEKIEWLLAAREGFDEHARDAWHLLIPVNRDIALIRGFSRKITMSNLRGRLFAILASLLRTCLASCFGPTRTSTSF